MRKVLAEFAKLPMSVAAGSLGSGLENSGDAAPAGQGCGIYVSKFLGSR